MKRKLDVGGPSTNVAPIVEDEHVNVWTRRPYSSRYYEILRKRKQLPVYEFKDELQEKVQQNQVIIVEGETGD